MKTFKVKNNFIYIDMNGVRHLAGKKFDVHFEVTPDEVDKRAMEGNPACFNFCYRRDDFLPEFNKKLYYGHIVDDEGYDLGYVMCEDELEEEKEIMKKYKDILRNKKFIQGITAIIALLIILLLTTGCNKQVIDLDYSFDKAICVIGNETKEFKLRTWKDYDGEQLQLMDKDGNKYLVSSFNCTLIKESKDETN